MYKCIASILSSDSNGYSEIQSADRHRFGRQIVVGMLALLAISVNGCCWRSDRTIAKYSIPPRSFSILSVSRDAAAKLSLQPEPGIYLATLLAADLSPNGVYVDFVIVPAPDDTKTARRLIYEVVSNVMQNATEDSNINRRIAVGLTLHIGDEKEQLLYPNRFAADYFGLYTGPMVFRGAIEEPLEFVWNDVIGRQVVVAQFPFARQNAQPLPDGQPVTVSLDESGVDPSSRIRLLPGTVRAR